MNTPHNAYRILAALAFALPCAFGQYTAQSDSEQLRRAHLDRINRELATQKLHRQSLLRSHINRKLGQANNLMNGYNRCQTAEMRKAPQNRNPLNCQRKLDDAAILRQEAASLQQLMLQQQQQSQFNNAESAAALGQFGVRVPVRNIPTNTGKPMPQFHGVYSGQPLPQGGFAVPPAQPIPADPGSH
jgi:hypothetical protein